MRCSGSSLACAASGWERAGDVKKVCIGVAMETPSGSWPAGVLANACPEAGGRLRGSDWSDMRVEGGNDTCINPG